MISMRWMVGVAWFALGAAPAAGQHMRMGAPGQEGGMTGQGMMQMCQARTSGGAGMSGHTMMGGGGAMQGHSMMGGGGMMGTMQGMMHGMGPSPAAFVGAAERLGLTPDQTSRLEALAMSSGQSHQAHMDAATAARQEAAEALGAGSADLDAYEDQLRTAAEHMVQAHMVMIRAGLEATAVLTPAQRAELESGMALMTSMACGMMSGEGKMKGGAGSEGEHAQRHR